MEPTEEMIDEKIDEKIADKIAEKVEPEEKQPSHVWRGTPRVWERCMFCEMKKKCSSAGVVRGSKSCSGARYSRVRR